MTIDPQTLSNLIMGLATWAVAFLMALWLALILWTYRDIRSRVRDPLIRIMAVIIVAILFLPGIAVYLILRPPQTFEEEYQHTLEEEALLQSIEDIPLCPGCGRHVKDAWTVCPNCHTKLKKPCHNCRKLMDLSWNLCPYCGTPAPGMRRENQTLEDVLRPTPREEDFLTESGEPPEEPIIEDPFKDTSTP